MSSKIIMLGGRRAGKSTILATIIHQLQNRTPGTAFTISDQTHYEPGGNVFTLNQKRIEIENYITTRLRTNAANNSNFLVNMNPSNTSITYSLKTQVNGGADVYFDFVDVPGEWMNPQSTNHNELIDEIRSSDVFIIAIDTPYMMQDNSLVNEVYNRIEPITNMVANLTTEDASIDKKLIILCPVKCEKWTNAGTIDHVVEKVKQSYRHLINTWVNNPAVDIWIMPIETAGGIEHSRMLDAYKVFRTENDRIGETCSIIEETGQILLSQGNLMNPDKVIVSENPDQEWCVDSVQIPLSWYHTNGKRFSPRFCEQPAYHILRFLVNKEIRVLERRESWIPNILHFIWQWVLPFGRYLDAYKKAIAQIEIKENGDGFTKITECVETKIN